MATIVFTMNEVSYSLAAAELVVNSSGDSLAAHTAEVNTNVTLADIGVILTQLDTSSDIDSADKIIWIIPTTSALNDPTTFVQLAKATTLVDAGKSYGIVDGTSTAARYVHASIAKRELAAATADTFNALPFTNHTATFESDLEALAKAEFDVQFLDTDNSFAASQVNRIIDGSSQAFASWKFFSQLATTSDGLARINAATTYGSSATHNAAGTANAITLSGTWDEIPFVVGDTISFTITVTPHANNNTLATAVVVKHKLTIIANS